MAVYRFTVKNNGVCGVVRYTAGMNVEVADTQARQGDNPFNTRTKKIFIQEFASKYNLKQDFSTTSALEAMFKRDKLDAQEISVNIQQPQRGRNSGGSSRNSGGNRGRSDAIEVEVCSIICDRCKKWFDVNFDVSDDYDLYYCSESCKRLDFACGKKGRAFIAPKKGLFSRLFK